jgi:hypothetical protein
MAPEFLTPKNSSWVVALPYSTKTPLWHSQYPNAGVQLLGHKLESNWEDLLVFGIYYSVD